MARALAADPPVLLMDEPFSAVDPIVRATLQDELIKLQAELHKTVVLVTHDVEEAIKVGDQVAIFRPGGHLAQVASPERLLGAPADDYVGDFLGFDRGIRRLSFFPAAGLKPCRPGDGGRGQPRGGGARGGQAGRRAVAAGGGEQGAPLGWASVADLKLPRCRRGPRAAGEVGRSLTGTRQRTHCCAAALDATMLSPAGRAVGVDAAGPRARR